MNDIKKNNSGNELFGHPRGLYYLFFAELWERFSFYGMRALLTLYMVEKVFSSLVAKDTAAAVVYASYGSLVYASAVFGGKTADVFLGFRRSIFFGGILMTVGHIILAFHRTENMIFFLGLALIIVGNGFFKPNISSFVGTLYNLGDRRKDSGFTLFYMGINIGAFLAPLFCGWLARAYGWHYGFGLAGLGMMTGLLFFYRGIKKGVFFDKGLSPKPAPIRIQHITFTWEKIIPFAAILSVPVIALLLASYKSISGGKTIFGDTNIVGLSFQLFGILIVLYLIILFWGCTPEERKRMLVILFLSMFMTVFWGFSELSGSIITLFASRNMQLKIINAAQSNAIWPMFVIILSIPFSLLWRWLDLLKLNPRTPYKFGFGMIFLSIAFFTLGLSRHAADPNGYVPFIYIIILYLLITIGELFMSPVGLAKITDLSPKRYLGFMMGIWFLSSAFAFQIVGFIGKKLAVEDTLPNQLTGGLQTLNMYTDGFLLIGKYALGAGIFILIIAPMLKQWMGKIH